MNEIGQKELIKLGIRSGILSMFPVAYVLALSWKFPIPLMGYASGYQQAVYTPVAVVFYGVVCGGFFLVGWLGMLSGKYAFIICDGKKTKGRRFSIALSICATLACGVALNLLEFIIGPW